MLQITSQSALTVARGHAIWRLMRPHQWAKNILLLVPVLLAHQLLVADKLLVVLCAFIAFSAGASAVYIVNDLLDIQADRQHPVKRHRPLASGLLPAAAALPLAIALVSGAIGLSLSVLSAQFVSLLVLYLVTSSAYSFWLKRKPIIDVLLLAGLYSIRLLAGGAAAEVAVSQWLLAFAMFFFTSLAFAKRYAELDRSPDQTDPHGRGYDVADLSLIETLGPTSGYLAVLVFSLYLHSAKVEQLYAHTWVLWLICPLILYWISRVWLLAKRHKLSEDPVVFAVTDRVSLSVGALVALLLVIAGGLK